MGATRRPTQKDIATKANVSISTVSRVFRNHDHVKASVRERVEEVIQELNYSRSGTRNTKSIENLVAVVVPDITNPYFPLEIHGIQSVAKIRHYNILLCCAEDDLEVEERFFRELLTIQVDGLICIPSTSEQYTPTKYLHDDMPLVFLDREPFGNIHSAVCSANKEGAYNATKYLLKLGHRKIVYLAGPGSINTEKERFNGYSLALHEQDIEVNQDLILRCNYKLDKAQLAMTNFLEEKRSDFTAVFATNDVMAYGAIKALQKKGLLIPKDVSIMGFDDLPYSELISLSTVAQPKVEMGRNAMMLLIDLIEKRVKHPQRIVLRNTIVIRDSCHSINLSQPNL